MMYGIYVIPILKLQLCHYRELPCLNAFCFLLKDTASVKERSGIIVQGLI